MTPNTTSSSRLSSRLEWGAHTKPERRTPGCTIPSIPSLIWPYHVFRCKYRLHRKSLPSENKHGKLYINLDWSRLGIHKSTKLRPPPFPRARKSGSDPLQYAYSCSLRLQYPLFTFDPFHSAGLYLILPSPFPRDLLPLHVRMCAFSRRLGVYLYQKLALDTQGTWKSEEMEMTSTSLKLQLIS